MCERMHGYVQANTGSSPVQMAGMKLRTTKYSAQIQVCFACGQRLCLYSLCVLRSLGRSGEAAAVLTEWTVNRIQGLVQAV